MKNFLAVLVAAILFSGLLPGQQGRGTFTGIVTDSTGAIVPEVQVAAVNTGTGSKFPTVTTSSGQYTVPGVPTGTYDLIFELRGFSRLVQRNVEVGVAEVRRVDVVLKVGAVTESVEVTAAVPRLQTDAPDVATSLQNSSLIDLPLAIGDGGRTMENLVYKIVPGTAGTSYRSYIVGTQAWSKATLLDGATTDVVKPGHFGESSVSMEAVQEFKAQTSAVSAEFGRSQGAVFNYVMKSGTNELHGSGYGLLRNEALNANTFANNANGRPRDRDRKWDYALSAGGPVYLPKAYNGRNKSFFYFTWERYHEDNTVYGSPNVTVPIPDFYEGNFSRLLGSRLNFTDAQGNPVYQGAIYDPATFSRLPNGRWVGQMFPGNTLPKSRFSRVASKVNGIMQKYYLPTVKEANGEYALINNAYRPLSSIVQRDQKQLSIKGDHNLSDYHKISGSFSLTNRSRYQTGNGVWNREVENGGPLSAAQWQNLNSRFARLAHNWTASPTVVNHFLVYYNRSLNDLPNAYMDIDGLAELGISGLSLSGYPIFNWSEGPFVKPTNPGFGNHYFLSADAGGIQETLSYSRGRHFLKIGGDWRRNIDHFRGPTQIQFNFSASATAIPFETFSANYTGYSVASYLLGIVNSGSIQRQEPFGFVFDFASAFVQDDFKVNNSLTLQLGLRWDYRAPIREKHNYLASWSFDATDPVSGLKGAYTFAGDCPTCIGSSYFSPKDWNNFAPRIGFAWQVRPKTTIRGAYAIFYQGPGDLSGADLGAATRFPATPTYAYGADPVNPWAGRHNLDDGIPIRQIYQAPTRDPSWHINNSAGMYDPNEAHMPYIQRWNLNIQRELARNLVLDVGYLGVKGTALYGGSLSRVNQLPTSVLKDFGQRLTRPVTNAQQAADNGVRYPYPGYQGTVAGALRQYPQVRATGTVTNVGNNLGFSQTHSFQAVLDKRFSSGLNSYMSYTWQKTLANKGAARDFDGIDTNYPLDYYNLALEKTVVPYDVPHMLKLYGSYQLPFGRGKRILGGASKPLHAIVGGWSISAILNYLSGTPLAFTGATNWAGWNGATNRLNIAPGEIVSSTFSQSKFNFANTNSASNTYLNKGLFSDPGAYTLGTAAHFYTSARDFGKISEDIGLQKNHVIAEKYRFQIRAEFLNLFNRSTLGGVVGSVVTDFKSSNFGQVTSISGYRSVQLGVRLDF